MPRVKVQCRGSGQQTAAGINIRRARCAVCAREQDVTGTGRLRRHDRLMTRNQMRRGR